MCGLGGEKNSAPILSLTVLVNDYKNPNCLYNIIVFSDSRPLPDSSESHATVERRGKPRVACSYPATVRGHLPDGIRFESRAVLSNMSASGMYFRTQRKVQPGQIVFVVVRMSTASLVQESSPRLAAFGQVVRMETKVDGTYGIALKLVNHRFL